MNVSKITCWFYTLLATLLFFSNSCTIMDKNLGNLYQIEIESIAVAPWDYETNHRVKIEKNGAVFYSHNKEYILEGKEEIPIWNTSYSEKPLFYLSKIEMKELLDLVNSSGFFDLKTEYEDKNVHDGSSLRITVILDSNRKAVFLKNIEIPQIKQIIEWINPKLPIENQIKHLV